MKRTVYGTWPQIKYVINQNNKLNCTNPPAGYSRYEVESVTEKDLPVRPNWKLRNNSLGYDPKNYHFINYNAMINPRSEAAQDAKRTKMDVEYFKITLYKE